MKQAILIIAFTFSCSFAFSQLTGTYTIGGTSPDYTTINAAVTALTQQGVSGPVVFNIRSNTLLNPVYLEQVLIPSVNGSSTTNTITFQSESGNPADIIIAHPGDGTARNPYVVRLFGADHIIFKSLTIRSMGAAFGAGIHLAPDGSNTADKNEIRNCHVEIDSTVTNNAAVTHIGIMVTGVLTSATATALTYAMATSGSRNLISGNRIRGGMYGIYFTGKNINAPDSFNSVIGNDIRSIMHCMSVNNNTAFTATGNSFNRIEQSTKSTGTYFKGCSSILLKDNTFVDPSNRRFELQFWESNVDFEGNLVEGNYTLMFIGDVSDKLKTKVRIRNSIFNGSGTSCYLRLYMADSSEIRDCRIINTFLSIEGPDEFDFTGNYVAGPMQLTTSTSDDAKNVNFLNNYIIYKGDGPSYQNALHVSCGGRLRNSRFVNNVFIAGAPGKTITGVSFSLMEGGILQNIDFHHNSILNLSPDPSGATSCFKLLGDNHLDVFIRNNIFNHQGEGKAFHINTNKIKENNFRFDFNLVYTKGAMIARDNDFQYPRLSDFQRVTGTGANLVFGDPEFKSGTDLHIQNPIGEGMGVSLAVPYDFDQEPRNPVYPDIGMDETEFMDKHDIGVLSVEPFAGFGTTYIKAILVNKGILSVKDSMVALAYSVDGGLTWSAPEQLKIKSMTSQYDKEGYVFNAAWNTTEIKRHQVCVKLFSLASDKNATNELACGSVCVAPFGEVITIGSSSSATFKTIVEGIDYLKSFPCGINGPLVFNIEPGIYYETLVIPPIEGTSLLNTITFQSSTGKAADVMIIRTQDRALANTISLQGVDHVIFNGLTIINMLQGTGSVMVFSNNSNYNTVKNCSLQIVSPNAVQNLTNNIIMDGTGNLIENNLFTGGGSAVYLRGTRANRGINNVIKNNTMRDVMYGVNAEHQANLHVLNNHIALFVATMALSDAGIHLLSVTTAKIDGNEITNIGNYGISLSSAYAVLISNNIISGFKGEAVLFPSGRYAIYIPNGGGVQVYHNTIDFNVASAQHLTAAIFTGSSVIAVEVFNNIILNTLTGYAFYYTEKMSLKAANHNDLYTNGQTLGYYGGTLIKNLAEWTFYSKRDSNSVSFMPVFLSTPIDTDYHTLDVQLDGKGLPLADVQTDFDGQPRNAASPDIGADEFTLVPFDIAVADAFPHSAVTGNNTVKVVLRNEGLNSLVDSTVMLSYSVDGGKTWTSPEQFESQNLGSFYKTEEFTFSVPWNISKPGAYRLKVRINAPGLLSDQVKQNDSLSMAVCMVLKEGTYTVGTPESDFTTMTSLAALLNLSCGIEGPVVFNVKPGIYEDQVSLPFIPGSSAENTVTFRSATGNPADVVFNSDADQFISNYIFRLYGAKHIRFQSLGFRHTGVNYGSGIHLSNGTADILVENCTFEMDSSNDFGQTAAILASDTLSMLVETWFSDLVIRNNVFKGGNYAVKLTGNPLDMRPARVRVEANTILSATSAGISLENTDRFTIHKNIIRLKKNAAYGIGLSVKSSDYQCRITANRITDCSSFGMLLQDIDQLSAGFSAYSIVANNMVGGGFNAPAKGYGMYLNRCGKIKIYYNSVHYDHAETDSSFCAYLSGGNSLHLRNNVFANSAGGYALYVRNPEAVGLTDYNDLYTSGPVLAYWNGNSADLAAFRTACSQEAHSVSANPEFFSSVNLHTFNPVLDGNALAFPEITEDIDGQFRNGNAPDIGADEFSVGLDGGIVSFISPDTVAKEGESYPVKVLISNYGNVSFSNSPVIFSVNNVQQASEVHNAAIAASGTGVHEFGLMWTPAEAGIYELCAKTGIPGDIDAVNDTWCMLVKVADSASTGIAEQETPYLVYPNPASSFVYIQFPDLWRTGELSIVNMYGQLCNRFPVKEGFIQYDVSHLKPGVYLLRVQGENFDSVHRLVISR